MPTIKPTKCYPFGTAPGDRVTTSGDPAKLGRFIDETRSSWQRRVYKMNPFTNAKRTYAAGGVALAVVGNEVIVRSGGAYYRAGTAARLDKILGAAEPTEKKSAGESARVRQFVEDTHVNWKRRVYAKNPFDPDTKLYTVPYHGRTIKVGIVAGGVIARDSGGGYYYAGTAAKLRSYLEPSKRA